MIFETFLNSVIKIENIELPGEEAQAKMSPPYRLKLAKQMADKRKEAKEAGVMALFYPTRAQQTSLALILRKTYKGVHSAQVGFPGGKYEIGDENFTQTALRETEEEIGIDRTRIHVVKAMSPMYIPPSNFIVHPFVGFTEHVPEFKKQDDEVEAIIEVSLNDFLKDTNVISTKVPTSYNVEVEVPAFHLNNHIVWGATAMMLSEIKDLLKQVL